MGGKSSAPAAPNPYAVSGAQTGSNVTTALGNADLNRYTTNTPLGTSSWQTNGYQTITDPTTGAKYQIPNATNTISLNPTAQSALNTTQQNQLTQAQTEQGFLGNVAQQLQNPLSASQFSPIQTNMYGSGSQGAEQQAFNSQYSLVAPLMQQQTQQMQDQMRAEGIPEGSDLWNTQSQNVGRQQSNQIAGLAGNAVGLGMNEQQIGNQAQSQQLQQALALQNQPLNELNALQTGSQVSMPQVAQPASVSMPGTNVAGNVYSSYQGQVNSANAANASSNNMFGSLLGAGGTLGAAYMLSDRRTKKDIEPVGRLYQYRYKWEDEDAPKHIGVMAQEVESIRPDAVMTGADGLKRVDYAKLLGASQ